MARSKRFEKELAKLDHPEVQIKILQATVGGITVADVTLASASNAVIVGFNVIPDDAARSLADDRNVEIRRYDVIYKVSDDIKAMLEGKLKPEERAIDLGQAVVKQVFGISRVGAIAGCYVVRGSISAVAEFESIAMDVRSETTNWSPSAAKKMMSRRSHAAWNAASNCLASAM